MIISKSARRRYATCRLRRERHRTTVHISGSALTRHTYTAGHNGTHIRAPCPLSRLVSLQSLSRALHPAGRACTFRSLHAPHSWEIPSATPLRNRRKQRRGPELRRWTNLFSQVRLAHPRDQSVQWISSAGLWDGCQEPLEALPRRRGSSCLSRQRDCHTGKSERLHPCPRKALLRFRDRIRDDSAPKDARRLCPAGRAIPLGLCKGGSPQHNCSEPRNP